MKYVVSCSTLASVIFSLSLTILSSAVHAGDAYWLKDKTDKAYNITVYHSPSCSCCKEWIAHLREHNFVIKDMLVDDINKSKKRLDVPEDMMSCHTAEINGKVIEGHVPAQDIKRLVETSNNIRLLAVPGMFMGSPGMEVPFSPNMDFNVMALSQDNKRSLYKEYKNY